jgi:urocanate hydratase
MMYDVMGGVARRAWARNPHAIETSETFNKAGLGHVTLPYVANDDDLSELVKKKYKKGGY